VSDEQFRFQRHIRTLEVAAACPVCTTRDVARISARRTRDLSRLGVYELRAVMVLAGAASCTLRRASRRSMTL
jgi:hypothetical protein